MIQKAEPEYNFRIRTEREGDYERLPDSEALAYEFQRRREARQEWYGHLIAEEEEP